MQSFTSYGAVIQWLICRCADSGMRSRVSLVSSIFIGSKSALLNYTQTYEARAYIIGTESGIVHQMRKASPGKEFIEGPPEADSLLASKQQAPHFYLRGSARVDRLLKLRRRLNEASAVRISVNDLIVKAVARAHVEVPEMNVSWTPEAVRAYSTVDIGVAVATERGLLTPVLRAVEAMPVSVVATTVRDLADRANSGRLRQDELEGGSITVTNLGMHGVEEFVAIINPPQSAILAVGAARPEPVVGRKGRLVSATVMRFTLSVDHRPLDGVVAARWMGAFVAAVESPLGVLV
jgi:pyruvate dehydrogenase E2 component (dihydrolipoamide acetyltransferase)